MREISPWEGSTKKPLEPQTLLGRITSVDMSTRTCRVKTDYKDYPFVQFPSMSASPDNRGDEDTIIPRPGQICIITMAQGEPYIIGFFRPTKTPAEETAIKPTEDPRAKEEELINPGDRIIRTVAGNRLILRAGGTVELIANQLCRRVMSPSGNTITDVAGQYELETDAGFLYAERDDTTQDTIFGFFMYDNLKPKYAVDFQVGKTDDAALLYQLKMGAINPVDFTLTPNFKLGIAPSGDVTVAVLAGGTPKFETKIEAATGNVTQTIQGNLKQDVTGNVEQTVKGNSEQTVQGNVKQNVTGNVDQVVNGNLTVDTTGNITGTSKGDISLSEAGGGAVKLSKGSVAIGVKTKNGELCDLALQHCDTFINNASSIVATGMGPGVLNPGVVAALTQIKTILGLIKGSL